MKYVVTTDGSSNPNPGRMVAGVVIATEDNVLKEYFSADLGWGTNNRAEYLAAMRGIEKVLAYDPSEIELHVDSQLLAKQLSGEWVVKDKELARFRSQILNMLHRSGVSFQVVWAGRKEGARPLADALSKNLMGKAKKLADEMYTINDNISEFSYSGVMYEDISVLQKEYDTNADNETLCD
jgi:ribonuclease HI